MALRCGDTRLSSTPLAVLDASLTGQALLVHSTTHANVKQTR